MIKNGINFFMTFLVVMVVSVIICSMELCYADYFWSWKNHILANGGFNGIG